MIYHTESKKLIGYFIMQEKFLNSSYCQKKIQSYSHQPEVRVLNLETQLCKFAKLVMKSAALAYTKQPEMTRQCN